MDKETLEKMEGIIINAMTDNGEYHIEDVGEHATEIAQALIFNGYRKLPEDKPPLLSEIKRGGFFENELEWLYQRLASDVEALVPENLQDNVRWIIKQAFGKGIIEAQRRADIEYYEKI